MFSNSTCVMSLLQNKQFSRYVSLATIFALALTSGFGCRSGWISIPMNRLNERTRLRPGTLVRVTRPKNRVHVLTVEKYHYPFVTGVLDNERFVTGDLRKTIKFEIYRKPKTWIPVVAILGAIGFTLVILFFYAIYKIGRNLSGHN